MGHLSWNYFYQLNEDQSLYLIKNEPIDFVFKTNSEWEVEELFLHTNSLHGHWEYVHLNKLSFNHFSSSLEFSTCGLFHFKLII